MKRQIISINEELCNGCGDCVPVCHEGALQIIDGKARLISDLFCDGLGACLGHCPTGALKIEEREAEPYNETKVMEYIVKGGPNVIKAHLEHLRDHEEFEFLTEALEFLRNNNIPNPLQSVISTEKPKHGGCAGSREFSFETKKTVNNDEVSRQSHLNQWPVQLHLVSPQAAHFRNSDLLLAADCAAFSYGDFHKDFMNGKSLAIACPKLDDGKEIYVEKLISMIKDSKLNSITAVIMEVPCCSGLLQLAAYAIKNSGVEIPLKAVVIGVRGEIIKENLVQIL